MGDIPRLEFEQLDPELKRLLSPRVQRLGYFGEYFRIAAHQPRALELSVALVEELKLHLSQRLVEVVALTQAAFFGNEYERIQHERLSAALGYDHAWISAVEGIEDANHSLSLEESCVRRVTLAVLSSNGHQAMPEVAEAAELLGPETVVALLLLIGKYAGDSLFMNANALTPPAKSIFAKERA